MAYIETMSKPAQAFFFQFTELVGLQGKILKW